MARVFGESREVAASIFNVYGSDFRGCFAAVMTIFTMHHRINNRHFKHEGGLHLSDITYTLIGDYLLPNIVLHGEENGNGEIVPLGKYGLMHKAYLREHRPVLYSRLLLTEQLYPLCREVDEAAALRLAAIADRETAHEIILAGLVYD